MSALTDLINGYQPGILRSSGFRDKQHPAIAAATIIAQDASAADFVINFQLTENFLETHEVTPGSESARIWHAIINERFVDPSKKGDSQEIQRIDTALRALSSAGKLTQANFKTFKNSSYNTNIIQGLPISFKRSLQNIVRGYDQEHHHFSKPDPHTNDAHETIRRLSDDITLEDLVSNNAKKSEIALSFFKAEPFMKPDSKSYQVWVAIIKQLYPDMKNSQSETIKTIYRNIIALKKYGTTNQITDIALSEYISNPNKVLPNDVVTAQKRRCGLFSCNLFSGRTKRIVLIDAQMSIDDIVALQNKYQNKTIPKNEFDHLIQQGLTKGLVGCKNNEKINQDFFVVQYLNHNRLADIVTFASDDVFSNKIKEHLPIGKTQSNEQILIPLLETMQPEDFKDLPAKVQEILLERCTWLLKNDQVGVKHLIALMGKKLFNPMEIQAVIVTLEARGLDKSIANSLADFTQIVPLLLGKCQEPVPALMEIYLKQIPVPVSGGTKDPYKNSLIAAIQKLPENTQIHFYQYLNTLTPSFPSSKSCGIPIVDAIQKKQNTLGSREVYGNTTTWTEILNTLKTPYIAANTVESPKSGLVSSYP